MSAPATGSDPTQDGDGFTDPDDEALSGEAASDPEAARKEAEDALARIEALADLDEEPELDSDLDTDEPPSSSRGPNQGHAPEEDDAAGVCQNCGTPLHGPYCSQCGQRAADRIVPVWQMINEGLETVVDLDLRVFRTLPTFFSVRAVLQKRTSTGAENATSIRFGCVCSRRFSCSPSSPSQRQEVLASSWIRRDRFV